jgi:methylated-DNA-protein-cysteine methyltransferase-like protein
MPPNKTFDALFRPLSARRANPRRRAPADENSALQAMWDVVCAIPRGQVATYGAVARAAGFPGRARLAGFALKAAPEGTNVPWHRVVGAGGRIVFPKASREHREQTRRLRAEGIAVKDGRVPRDAMMETEQL